MEKKTVLSNFEIMSFALPNAVSAMVHLIPVMYGMMFMTEYLGISAAAMATAMLVTKLMDYGVAIFAGSIIEKTHSKKHGKYALWLRITTFTLFFGSLLQLLNTNSIIPSSIGRLIFVSIFYCTLHFGMNFRATSQGGLLQRMAGTSMETRKILNARNGQFSAMITIIFGAITIPLIEFFGGNFGEANGYALTIVVYGALFMALSFFMLFPVMKKYDIPREKAEIKNVPPVRDMFKSIITNNQMIVMFFMITSMTVGTQIYTPLVAYYFNVVTGRFAVMTLLLTVQGISAFLFSLVAPAIARKLGKKGTLMFSSGLSLLCYVGIWLLGLNNLWALVVFASLIKGAEAIYRCFAINYFLDCGEYGYYTTGQDNRTMALTVMNWPIKIGFMAGGTAVGYGLALIGYEAGMVVTDAFSRSFMMLFGLVPAALLAITFLLAMFAYKLTDEQSAFYAAENNKREAAMREAALNAAK
ncbi:MFS transporter [Alkalibacter rhizosphaerae]|uniref:MFS transporter n=1 Tax=Alkalibacter rhizosphaerae TaxID=2815577 RepID=A0A974XGV3_9FIRM|nr:MFS transporter [Alkalibacter rhizosphaerae]QSX09456.1 MFS transporter [Alkalibacter rhizosphaerae]